jgi:hypothetical protein
MSIHVRVLESGGDEGGALASSPYLRKTFPVQRLRISPDIVFGTHFEIFQCETKRVALPIAVARNEQRNSTKVWMR